MGKYRRAPPPPQSSGRPRVSLLRQEPVAMALWGAAVVGKAGSAQSLLPFLPSAPAPSGGLDTGRHQHRQRLKSPKWVGEGSCRGQRLGSLDTKSLGPGRTRCRWGSHLHQTTRTPRALQTGLGPPVPLHSTQLWQEHSVRPPPSVEWHFPMQSWGGCQACFQEQPHYGASARNPLSGRSMLVISYHQHPPCLVATSPHVSVLCSICPLLLDPCVRCCDHPPLQEKCLAVFHKCDE